ncbi:MAG: hypothetical protein HC831_03015 [Chloroflexia bacterium]|nr:hypothetical protein [Chloroflexia bacterium]
MRWNKEYKLLKENKRKSNPEKEAMSIIKKINLKEFKKFKKRVKRDS